MDENEIVVSAYSLTRRETNIVERESEKRALHNRSAALRQIIREWEEMRLSRLAVSTHEQRPTAV